MGYKSMYEEFLLVFRGMGMNVEKIDRNGKLTFYVTVPKTVELVVSGSEVPGFLIAECFKSFVLSMVQGLLDVSVRFKMRDDDWSKEDTQNMIKILAMQENLTREKFTEVLEQISEYMNKEDSEIDE